VDVTAAEAHALLAGGLAGSGEPRRAIEEYDVAVGLDPQRLEWRLALARACAAAGDRGRARRVLEELLALDADHPGAREALEELGK
jgi:predicted Zn-dependent protease